MRIVLALGGNALGNTPEEQREAVKITAKSILDLIESGNKVIIGHGNGPQVGMINTALDIAAKAESKIPQMPFPECGAMSQRSHRISSSKCHQKRSSKKRKS